MRASAGLLKITSKRLAAAGTAGAAGWILYSRLGVPHDVYLPPAIDAQRKELETSCGRLSYYVDARAGGRPLVLLHSINAAASSYEVRPLFNRYRRERAIYALDLPGFGFSERGRLPYSPQLYARAIRVFLEEAVREPADVAALSLASEFAARAAASRPELFHSLTLVSPTGFSGRRIRTGPANALFRAVSVPLWSQAFFDLLTTGTSIRYYLRKSFAGTPDKGLAEYDFATAHQSGARFAPLAFVGGKLFTPDAPETLYSPLSIPVLVLYDRDGYTDFGRLPSFVRHRPNWTAVRLAGTHGLPHFDKPEATAAALDRFWAKRLAA